MNSRRGIAFALIVATLTFTSVFANASSWFGLGGVRGSG